MLKVNHTVIFKAESCCYIKGESYCHIKSTSYSYVIDGSYFYVKPESYCYGGQCGSRDSQCSLLWGSNVQGAPDSCYTVFNAQGRFSGNCGTNWIPTNVSYIPCAQRCLFFLFSFID